MTISLRKALPLLSLFFLSTVILAVGFQLSRPADSKASPADATAPPIAYDLSEEGFRFQQDIGVLTLRGTKPAGIGLEIVTRFASLDPACQGMFATDTGDINYVYKPRAGARGLLFKAYQLQEEQEGDYIVRVPMRVTHPECQWRLTEIEVLARNSYTDHGLRHRLLGYRTEDSPNSSAREHGSQFLRWVFYTRKHIHEEGAKPECELFPEQIDAQCYNSVSIADKDHMVACGAKGWPWRTTFPQTITEQDQSIQLDLTLHPDVVVVEEWQKQGKKLPWDEVAGFK